MPATWVYQRAFNGGELSPEMLARPDDPRYQAGLETMRNFLPSVQGAARRRPGFEHIVDAPSDTVACRLIPFERGRDDSLVIVMGPGYFRFLIDGDWLDVTGTTTPREWGQPLSITSFPSADSLRIAEPYPDPIPIPGQKVRLYKASGDWPQPLVSGRTYYVRNLVTVGSPITHYDVQLCAYPGGPALSWNYTAATATGAAIRFYYDIGDLATFPWGPGTSYTGTPTTRYCLQAHEATSALHPDQAAAAEYWLELTTSGAFELPNRYTEDELFDVQFVQSGDVMTLTHQHHPPVELRRYSNTQFTVSPISFTPEVLPPTGLVGTPDYGVVLSVQGVRQQAPVGTSLSSVARLAFEAPHYLTDGDTVFVAGSALAGIGIAEGYYRVGEGAVDAGAPGNGTELALLDPDTNEWIESTGTLSGSPPYGTVRYCPIGVDSDHEYVVTTVNSEGQESAPSDPATVEDNVLYVEGAKNVLTWDAAEGAAYYKVYRKLSGTFGYIGKVNAEDTLEFVDLDIDPDLSRTPPIADEALSERTVDGVCVSASDTIESADHGMAEGSPMRFLNLPVGSSLEHNVVYFARTVLDGSFQVAETPGGDAVALGADGSIDILTGDFPGAVGYHEGRRVFAGTLQRPQQAWLTRSDTESDLRYTLPVQPTDRVTFRLAARSASTIHHVVTLGDLLLLTDSTEYRVQSDGPITPDLRAVRAQSYVGASRVRPVVIDNVVVFAGSRGGHAYALGYDASANGFAPLDLTLRCQHLFDDYELLDAAHQRAPRSIIWAVSSSGRLLALSYARQEQALAWSWCDTEGAFEAIAAVSESQEDRLYAVVTRTIDGATVRTIERMAAQAVDDVADCTYLDGAVVSTTPGSTVSGLSHLEGESVTALVDGVIYTGLAVDSGEVTLPVSLSSRAVVGLPYTSTLKTTPLVLEAPGASQGRTMNVNEARVRVVESAPFQIGPAEDDLTTSDWSAGSAELASGIVDVGPLPPDWQVGGQVIIQQTQPVPLIVAGLAVLVTLGG